MQLARRNNMKKIGHAGGGIGLQLWAKIRPEFGLKMGFQFRLALNSNWACHIGLENRPDKNGELK